MKEKIIEIKNITGLSNKEIADLVGADKACVTRWLQGYYKPNLKYTTKINELYEQSLKEYEHYNQNQIKMVL